MLSECHKYGLNQIFCSLRSQHCFVPHSIKTIALTNNYCAQNVGCTIGVVWRSLATCLVGSQQTYFSAQGGIFISCPYQCKRLLRHWVKDKQSFHCKVHVSTYMKLAWSWSGNCKHPKCHISKFWENLEFILDQYHSTLVIVFKSLTTLPLGNSSFVVELDMINMCTKSKVRIKVREGSHNLKRR